MKKYGWVALVTIALILSISFSSCNNFKEWAPGDLDTPSQYHIVVFEDTINYINSTSKDKI